MSANDATVVGEPLPRIAQVSAEGGFVVGVTWESPTRPGRHDSVDLAPLVFGLKFYAPLRGDGELFDHVKVVQGGYAIAWGDDEAIDMAATSVLRLAEEIMMPQDFAAFMKRHRFTLDSAAAELGISRRLAAYYAKERVAPRYIALACECLDLKASRRATDAIRA